MIMGGIFENTSEIILELQFGEGGDDSKLFVDELFSAYLKYIKILNFKAELLESSEGHIIASVKGDNVGQKFQYEGGQHCCCRIPVTESKGRKQTSFIKVGILPIRNQNYEPINSSDLEITAQTGRQKAGGQNVNKVASAIRVKHIPTGISVFINGRDQYNNKQDALRIIAARVESFYKKEADSEYAKLFNEIMPDGNRGNKVRTYNFINSRVTDHRLGKKSNNIKAIMKGNFDLILG